MFCWLCCWGWWHLVRVSSLWWCVERSFWRGDKDLSLPGDVLWFWGWHCLAYSSWRFFEYTLIQKSSGTASRLRITRHPEWSSGLLRPCYNGIILYWIEWCGTSNLQRTRISAPRQSKHYFQCMLLNGNQLWRSLGSTGREEEWLVLTFKVWPCCTTGACAASSCKAVSMKTWVMNSAAAMHSEDKSCWIRI